MKIEGISSGLTFHKQSEVKAASESFAKVLENSLKETNRLQLEADRMDKLFAAGMIDNIADVTIASSKADIALSYTVEVISKVLNAYNELMRLQL
ncbi:MAG: flagellar hook-basal body complex protein FliE [Bacillota bacterium]|nr:flagellar hook-basal body complex protein FliE [Bacillota bacterium]